MQIVLALGSTNRIAYFLKNFSLIAWLLSFLGLSLRLLNLFWQKLFRHKIVIEKVEVDLTLTHCVVRCVLSRSFIEDFVGLFGKS